MKKKLITFAALFAAISLGMFVTSCDGNDNGDDPSGIMFNIVFNAGNGEFPNGLSFRRATTDNNGRIAPPTDVKLEGYKFIEWNSNSVGTGTTLTDNIVHNDNTTYFAIWEQDSFEVKGTWDFSNISPVTEGGPSGTNMWYIETAIITVMEAAKTGSQLHLFFDATGGMGSDRSSWGVGNIGIRYDTDEDLIGLRAPSGSGMIYSISLEVSWLLDILEGIFEGEKVYDGGDKLTIYIHAANGDKLTKIELLEPKEDRVSPGRPSRPPLPPSYPDHQDNPNFFAELEITYGASGDFTQGKGDIEGESLQKVYDLLAHVTANPHKAGIFRVWMYTERVGIAHWGVAQINGVQLIMGTDAFTHSYTDIGIDQIMELLEDASRLQLNPYNDHVITLVELWLDETLTITVSGEKVPGIVVTGRSGTVTLLPGDNDDFTGYDFTGTSGHRGKFAWFGVDFGDKKLEDYGQIKFRYKADGTNSRRLALLARTTPFPNGSLSNHQTIDNSGGGYLASWQVTFPMTDSISTGSQANWQDIILDIDPTFAEADRDGNVFTGQLYFSIYEHTPAPTTFSISNLEFIAHDLEQNNADISSAKTVIEAFDWAANPVRQPDVNTAAQAKEAVETIISGLDLNGVIATVVDGTFSAATNGNSLLINGTNGSYAFTVNLDKGIGTRQTTVSRSLIITAMPFNYSAPTSMTVNVGGTNIPAIAVNAVTGTVKYLDNTFAGIDHPGYEFTKGTGHRGSYASFAVNLSSKKLSDYGSVTFTYTGTASRTNIALIASSTPLTSDLLTHSTGGSGHSTLGSDNGYVAAGQVSKAVRESGALSGTVTLELDFTDTHLGNTALGNLTGTVYFSIYEHIGTGSVSRISNIRFIEK